MATSGVFNGTNLILKVIADGGTLLTIGHTTSCTFSMSNDLPIAPQRIQADIKSNCGSEISRNYIRWIG